MIFKKKKNMDTNEQMNDPKHSDNLTEKEQMTEEQMAQGINTDDTISGSQFMEDKMGGEEDAEGKLRQELAEMKDKYLRQVAEFDNFRRRNARERMELIQTAGREMMQAMLDVLDDSNRAAKQLETATDINEVKEGIQLVFNKLRNTMQQKGLTEMDSLHKEFDVELHEAITEIPSPTPDMQGKVLDVVQPGYYLNDKLIRHAKVVVGK